MLHSLIASVKGSTAWENFLRGRSLFLIEASKPPTTISLGTVTIEQVETMDPKVLEFIGKRNPNHTELQRVIYRSWIHRYCSGALALPPIRIAQPLSIRERMGV